MPDDFLDVASNKINVSLYQTLHGHHNPVLYACFAQDGHLIVSHDLGAIHVWERDDHQLYVPHCIIETATDFVAVSQDGRLIASIYEDRIFGIKVRLWSSDGKWITDLPHRDEARAIIFTPDGLHLIIVDRDGFLTLWDVTTYALLSTSELPPNSIKTGLNNWIRNIAFAPDGQHLAVTWFTKDGAVQIYEIAETLDGEEIQYTIRWCAAIASTVLQKKSLAGGLSYSPDWQYIAVASDMECIIWIFDAFALHLMRSIELPRSLYGIADIAYSADGKYLALAHGDGTVWIWDRKHHDPILCFTAHATALGAYSTVIGSIDWSPNNTLIMTTGIGRYENVNPDPGISDKDDNTIKLWKIQK